MGIVKFWGVQGTCPGNYFSDNLGSNTSCVSVEKNDTLIILDAGTGIRSLSENIKIEKYNKIILLLTHSHWDHIQGFPFFRYIYNRNKLDIFSHSEHHLNALVNQINGINFPVNQADLLSDIKQHTNLSDLNKLTDFNIESIKTNHHGNCVGYRLNFKDCSVTYIPDNQLHDPNITTFEEFSKFCSQTSLLIHDSQYTESDMPYKTNWGHSIYKDTHRLSLEANVKRLALFHHEPTRSKQDILRLAKNCQNKSNKVDVFAAYEGLEVDLLDN